MDIKVYKKEMIPQPDGVISVFKPDIIDIEPVFMQDSFGNQYLSNAVVLEDDTKELEEQKISLATIWQRGLDPLDLTDGIQWSEAILGEVNGLFIIEQLIAAVEKASTSATITFDTVTDDSGNEYLTYKVSSTL